MLRAHTLRDKQRLLASSQTSPRVPDPLFLPKSRRATALRHPQQRPAIHHTALPESHEEAAARRAARDPFVARSRSTTRSLTARWRGSPLSLQLRDERCRASQQPARFPDEQCRGFRQPRHAPPSLSESHGEVRPRGRRLLVLIQEAVWCAVGESNPLPLAVCSASEFYYVIHLVGRVVTVVSCYLFYDNS
jgi:hypothetical protein